MCAPSPSTARLFLLGWVRFAIAIQYNKNVLLAVVDFHSSVGMG